MPRPMTWTTSPSPSTPARALSARAPPPQTARPAWRSCGRTPPSWPTSPCSNRARTSRCTRGPPRWPAATPQVIPPCCTSGLAMRLRRLEQHRGATNDLLDIPRYPATLHRYDDIAGQAAQILPGMLATVGRAGLDPGRRPRGPGTAERREPARRHWPAGSDPPAGRDPSRRQFRQHRMAARPVIRPPKNRRP
jgi:hypothetical protein